MSLRKRLEQAEKEARRAQGQWLRSLSDEELEALAGTIPDEVQAALSQLTDEELEAIAEGEAWALARYAERLNARGGEL